MENVAKEARRDWEIFQRMGQIYILPVKHDKGTKSVQSCICCAGDMDSIYQDSIMKIFLKCLTQKMPSKTFKR